MFHQVGPGTEYQYDPNSSKSVDTQIDSITYSSGEVMAFYGGPEYRVSGRYTLNDISSIKASYNRTRQYIHVLSNSTSLSPTDTWRLSNAHLKPQVGDQISLGYYRNLKGNTIETSVEAYYKTLDNLIDFKTGAEFLLNNNVETVTLQGPGRSYGIELSLKKSGRLNGWMNYSYARTFIQLDSKFSEDRINRGEYFPASYDMPHTVNIVLNYKITKRFSFSYNGVYNTGKPVTYPVATYDFKGFEAVNYSDRNTYRIPDYLRMDIGLSLDAGHKKTRLSHSSFTLSVYNLLGRDNPYSVFFDLIDGQVQGYKLVVFGSPIPTLSYNFKF